MSSSQSQQFEILPQELTYKYNDSRHWNIPSSGPARALQVRMLSVSGSKKVDDKGKKYKVSFKVLLKDDAFGWDGTPLIVAAKVGRHGSYYYKQVLLKQTQSTSPVTIPEQDVLQIEVPADSRTDDTIHFGLYELSGRKWKGGLEIHSASIEPIN